MKRNPIKWSLISVLLGISIIVVNSCKEKDEQTNQAPTCTITNPQNEQEITQGETVTILVTAQDADGTIDEVQFYIDGMRVGNAINSPYNYEWVTSDEDISNHTIKATAIDNQGASKSDEINVQIKEKVLKADFVATPLSGDAPLKVSFTDQSTITPISWQWEFGDGGTSTQQNPSHTYTANGSYTVKLTASNESGSKTEIKSDYIRVNISSNAPIADFTANITNGSAPLIVNFTNKSANSPTSWQWDFGDGATSTLQNPSHTYNADGSFTVSLTVKNGYGSDTKIRTNYIHIESGGSSGTFSDPRDGQTYQTIKIGNQTWFAENLNYEIQNSWCYNNDPANCEVYGRLYTWTAAIQSCPSGWHLPGDEDWKILELELGMTKIEADNTGWRGTDQGEQMKSTSGWNDNGNGTNSSGFNALPGGYRYGSNTFYHLGTHSYWWSSSEESGAQAWRRYLQNTYKQVGRYGSDKKYGLSVRCLKD